MISIGYAVLCAAILQVFSGPALAIAAFPEWLVCEKSEECTAVEGTCEDWEFVRKEVASERARKNIERRTLVHCLDLGAHKKAAQPNAACIHGVCADAKFLASKTPCSERRKEVDRLFTLGKSCAENSDCERGLDSCALDCEFRVYAKSAKPLLQSWVDDYNAHCSNCKKNCIDPAREATEKFSVRCVQERCVFAPLRTKF